MKGTLVLEDGSCFEGISVGVAGEKIGELVLNTSVVGYQEMITDPANAGKILVLTYPLIGNYGVAKKFYESPKSWIEGLVIKELSNIASNWQAEDRFDHFLRQEGIVTIAEVDTRTLAVKIRDNGELWGIISTQEQPKAELLERLHHRKRDMKRDFIRSISIKEVSQLKENPAGPRIGIIDLGIVNSLLSQLKNLGCNLTLLPYNLGAKKIMSMNFDGVVISSGPEEDEAIPGIVEVVKGIMGKLPILGIATGHQILCLALGGAREKMRVGHHGSNYPTKSPSSYKGEITIQNHSFGVNEDSIKERKDIHIVQRNVNDDSIEEMESTPLQFISTQYYPMSPGFDEAHEMFKRFFRMVTNRKGT